MVDSLPKRTEETKENLDCPDSENSKGDADMKMEECSSNNENNATSNDKGEGCSNESNGDVCAGENNLQAECLSLDSGDSKTNLVRQLSTAHCSIAELFMTDLCDEENAEEQCQAAITQGIQVDPSNPEAYQHMASFLLVKQDPEEAKTYINKSLELWLPKYKEVDEGKAEAGSFDPVEVCPLSYPTRLSAARILIEVKDYENAIDVLDGLTEEDDEVVDTWYLLGWTYYLQGEDYIDEAKYHLHIAMKVNKESPSDDLQLVEHLQELIEELGPYEEEETEATNDDEIEKELEADSDDDENVEEGMDTD
ncbi:hypothetical protein Pcinc_021247 [Petrolisthes cinctipes]|uniref:Uncharacterized protein n=1 Tax=Petrolisthes cinctipes TaxID=88211 RepID=A0AAE1FGB4_PETCI|nr:hypothetical protein Pcinc_021247 [Petrolisthes cinctipes]